MRFNLRTLSPTTEVAKELTRGVHKLRPVQEVAARYRPWAFTEHGTVMAANILHSERAVHMNVLWCGPSCGYVNRSPPIAPFSSAWLRSIRPCSNRIPPWSTGTRNCSRCSNRLPSQAIHSPSLMQSRPQPPFCQSREYHPILFTFYEADVIRQKYLYPTPSRHPARTAQPSRGLSQRLDETPVLTMPWLFDDNLSQFVFLLPYERSHGLRICKIG